MEDKIDFTITDEEIAEATKKLNGAVSVLQPYLLALTPEERMTLPKMSDKTQPFVEKTIDYCATAPQFAPPYLNIEALNADMRVYQQLIPLFRIVKRLSNGLDDTTMQAGAETYTHTLTYYNSVKMAAKIDVPGAKAIYNDLKKRFEKKTSSNDEAED